MMEERHERAGAYQIEMVAILKAVEKLYYPFGTSGGIDEGGRSQQVALRPHMSFLSFPQHVRLSQL